MNADVPALFTALFDDAAIFPPGNALLPAAVSAHRQHRASTHADLVGPFVVDVDRLRSLPGPASGAPAKPLAVSVTTPLERVADAVAATSTSSAVHLAAVEVAVGPSAQPDDVVPALREALDRVPETAVFVEVPFDGRGAGLLRALSGTGYQAKFRTGGTRADLHPSEHDLAGVILAAVQANVPFKATAGLHHATRNTDPATGFEQHGFLNLLIATAAALSGADRTEVGELLAERDATWIAARAASLDAAARRAFRSFGTCSIAEPVLDLVGLGLLDRTMIGDLR